MRLGDLDALKKAIKDKYNYASATAFLLTMRDILPQDVVYQILTIIDNAPTVDTTEQEEFAYNEGYAHGLETKRPQGEWEDYSVNFYKCPECGYLLNKDCPHCQNKILLPKGGAEE